MQQHLEIAGGVRIAYDRCEGRGPGVVFLGGFRSDKEGSKAMALEAWAQAQGRAFLRFDYSGHGSSSGAFEEGTIGGWLADSWAVCAALTRGPQILVGSSMGGWIALLMARARPEQVAGLVTVAAAADFTEEICAGMSAGEQAMLAAQGRIERPTEYSATPHVFSRRLIEDGRRHRVLTAPLVLPMPVRMLQGTDDTDVSPVVAVRLLDHAEGPDMRLTLVKGADHRFSSPECLEMILEMIEEVSR